MKDTFGSRSCMHAEADTSFARKGLARKALGLAVGACLCLFLCSCGADEKTEDSCEDYSLGRSVLPQPSDEEGEGGREEAKAEKPVIYLYPERERRVDVSLDLTGDITFAYPCFASDRTWSVEASPDGAIRDLATGKQSRYLFWEGMLPGEWDLSQGFCVDGAETVPFLEGALGKMGLTEVEATDFITYWAPRMEGNAYNLISFQNAAYAAKARLTVNPAPDACIRVFMVWAPLDGPADIDPQELEAFERVSEGFTLVEWGGAELSAR